MALQDINYKLAVADAEAISSSPVPANATPVNTNTSGAAAAAAVSSGPYSPADKSSNQLQRSGSLLALTLGSTIASSAAVASGAAAAAPASPSAAASSSSSSLQGASAAASSSLASRGFGVDVIDQVVASMAAVQRQAEAQVTTIVRTEGDAKIQTVKIVVPNFDVLEEVRPCLMPCSFAFVVLLLNCFFPHTRTRAHKTFLILHLRICI